MYRFARTTAIVGLIPLTLAANAQNSKDHDPLFAGNDTLEVRIEAPFGMLETDRPVDDYAAAKFRYQASDGSEVEFDAGLRTRGNYRLRKEVCPFPPLRVNFAKSQTKGTLFDKQDKLKLVTHCRTGSKSYEQSVVTEYLAYRILNLLTDVSFRARLLRVTYVYTDADREVENYAILIEHRDRMAKRINADLVQVPEVQIIDLRPDIMNLVSVFEYIIANTDYSPLAAAPGENCCHNIVLFQTTGAPYYAVPYDFDQSGIVNAPHAGANPRFGLSSVRQRLYRGRCINNNYLPASIELFSKHRDSIEALVSEQVELKKATRKRVLKFIDNFYRTVSQQKRVEREFVKKCI